MASEPQSPEEDEDGSGVSVGDPSENSGLMVDQQKILLFNCGETVDFSSGDAILPTRLTCYCRHHNEKLGFRVSFFVKDHTGELLASALSPPIMITDDHKSAKIRGVKRPRTESSAVNLTSQPYFLPQQPEQDHTFRRYSVPPSPDSPPFQNQHQYQINDSVHAGFDPQQFSQTSQAHKTSHTASGVVFKEENVPNFEYSDTSFDLAENFGREEEEPGNPLDKQQTTN